MAPEEELFRAALAAREKAHAPYSGFAVGCAIRAESGRIYAGCNIENQSYPEGWCAETSAIAHMVMAGEARIVEVCVVGDMDPPITPCGGCRQRLAEFAGPDTRLHLCDQTGIVETVTLKDIFPMGFEAEALR